MSCYEGYITQNKSVPSRSGLYAEDLPGVDSTLWDYLSKVGSDGPEFWEMIQKKAWDNFVSDLTSALQDKFYVDSKLVSRETSVFKTDLNFNTGNAGVRIEFKLPRYAKLHIVSVDVYSDQDYTSPEGVITVYDKDDVEISSHTGEITEGKSTIFIDRDFDESEVFVAFDPEAYAFRETENKKYDFGYYRFSCDECAFDCGGYEGKMTQVNGGGLNVKYNVVCSVEKYACQNINLFKQAYFFRIGLEIIFERRFGNRLNKFMTMTLERQKELMEFYNKNFSANLERSVRSTEMTEDPYCFSCKHLVHVKSNV